MEVLVGPVREGRSWLGGTGRFAEPCSELGSWGKLISPGKWERRRESIVELSCSYSEECEVQHWAS